MQKVPCLKTLPKEYCKDLVNFLKKTQVCKSSRQDSNLHYKDKGLTLLGPTYFLYTKARGGVKFHPPLKNQLSLKKSMFFCHEVNFCINSALFWCITLVSSSMLTKISNFIEKRPKFGTFLEIELYASYMHQNKAKTI